MLDNYTLSQIEILREAHDAAEARKSLSNLDNMAAALGRYKGLDREFLEHRDRICRRAFDKATTTKDNPLRSIKDRAKKTKS